MRGRIALTLLSLAFSGVLLTAQESVSHFVLTDDNGFEITFSKARGIVSASEVIEEDLRDPNEPPGKSPGRLMLTSVTLERPYSSDRTLAQWRREIEEGSRDAAAVRDLFLIGFDERGEEIARWDFRSAWPSRLTVAVREENSWEEATIVFDELPLDEGEPALPLVDIQLPAEDQILEESPVRVVAEVNSPESEVEILRIYGEGELLRDVSRPGARNEVEWNLSGDGTKSLSATVVDVHDRTVTVTRNFRYRPSPEIRYTTWRQAWFLPDEDGTPGGDADSDGSANLIEFAFRGHPHRGGTSELPGLEPGTTEGAWAEFSYVRRKEGTGSAVDFVRSDIRYLVEERTDLGSDEWMTSPVPDGITRSATVVPNEDGFTETVTISLLGDPPSDTLFMRLRVLLH